jgi:hypothetical protein
MNRWSALVGVFSIVAVMLGTGCNSSSGTAALYQPSQNSRITPLLPPPPDLHNWYQSGPTSGPTPDDFEVVYQEYVASDLGAGNFPHDFNPFCPPSVTQGCPVTVTYNPTTNTTTLEFSGTLSENLYSSANCRLPCYHFGGQSSANLLNGAQNAYAEWTFPKTNAPAPSPYVNVGVAHGMKQSKAWAYAEVFIAASLKPGTSPVFGSWEDIGYVPKGSTQPKFKFSNYGTQKLYVQSSGIILNAASVPTDPACRKLNPMCAENLKILATLNFAGSPPPGFSGSKFIPLQYPPPKILKPKTL